MELHEITRADACRILHAVNLYQLEVRLYASGDDWTFVDIDDITVTIERRRYGNGFIYKACDIIHGDG